MTAAVRICNGLSEITGNWRLIFIAYVDVVFYEMKSSFVSEI